MAKSAGQAFVLPKKPSLVDDLFTTQEQRDEEKRERVVDIPISEIDDFQVIMPDGSIAQHPFHVKMDEAMQNMADSIAAVGVQTPAIVRRTEEGYYQLISGHRRKTAAIMAGLEVLPVIVRDLSFDEAIIAMVDANLQREVILPSEKAFSYKMRLEAMKRQGERVDLTCVPLAHKLESKKSRQVLAEKSGESQDQIRRYIRITNLLPELLQMVDDGKIAFRPAVEVSYLLKEHQAALLETMQSEQCAPSLAQAQKMKRFSQEGRLDDSVILSIMEEEKPNQVEQFKMPKDKISKYFPPGTPAEKIEDVIIKALDFYCQRERKRSQDAR